MSRTYRKHEGSPGRRRRISARAVRRNPPDLRLLSKALLMQAADEAAAASTPSATPPANAQPPDDAGSGHPGMTGHPGDRS